MTDGLHSFIEKLKSLKEIIIYGKEISSDIEISILTDLESKKPYGGKALLFTNVKDSNYPVATNLFGSDRRMSLALNVKNLESAGEKISELTKLQPPKSFADFFNVGKSIFPLRKIFPKKFKGKIAPCQEIVKKYEKVNLAELPILKCWPKDGGKFITLPLVFTKSLDGKIRNLGMYRMQIYDKNTTGMHWHIHKDASHFFNQYKSANKKMPVAVAIGADPEVIYSATAPLPRGIDELLLAGFFKNSSVALVKCKTIDMEVPANAEFVLEGYIDTEELKWEGPFGDHTGYYSLPDYYPVFHITAITHKKNPIYCATLVGPPPMEDCYMAKATERIFLPFLKTIFPEINDYFLPWEGVFHNIVIVSIKKEYVAHAQRLISGLWGQGQMSFCKAIVIVDETINPSDLKSVWQKFCNNFDPKNDILQSFGVLDVLDHSSPTPMMGSKIGIDLTNRFYGEPQRPLFNRKNSLNPEEISYILKKYPHILEINSNNSFCGLRIKKSTLNGLQILKHLSQEPCFENFVCIVIFDENINVSNISKMLWKVFNNTDIKRDMLIHENSVFIDACRKSKSDFHLREWPEELTFDLA